MVRKTRKNGSVSATAAFNAINNHDTAGLAKLLAAGLNPNQRYKGEPLLMTATAAWHLDIMKLLLEKGADPSKKTKTGGTALLHAVDMEPVDGFLLLLADPRTDPSAAWNPYNEPITPLQYVVSHTSKFDKRRKDDNMKMIKMLLADARLDPADKAAAAAYVEKNAANYKHLRPLFK